jgi:hypothetical protein
MSDWFNLALSILACYRLSRLIAIDEGPALKSWQQGIFQRIRIKLGAYDYGSNGEAVTNIGRGIICPHCVGVWVAFPLALVGGIQWYTVIYWLAIAGGSSFLWSLRR